MTHFSGDFILEIAITFKKSIANPPGLGVLGVPGTPRARYGLVNTQNQHYYLALAMFESRLFAIQRKGQKVDLFF